jgi:predicted RND superfamily exporter protein
MGLRQRIDAGLAGWGRWMYRRHWLVLALAAAHTATMVTLLPDLRAENSSNSYLHGDDPETVRYDEFTAQFGQDSQILLAISPPDVFAPEFLERLRSFHRELAEEVPYLTDVTSLINARRTRGEGETLIVEDLLEEWPDSPADFAALRTLVFENPLYLDSLISRDGRTTTITLEPHLYSDASLDADGSGEGALSGVDESGNGAASAPEYLTGEERRDLVSALDDLVARYDSPEFSIEMVGATVTAAHVTEMMNSDVRAYMGVAGIAITLFLFALFRRISGVLLPMLTVASAMLTTLGTMVLMDMPFSIVLGMLPIFTMTVGVCTTVHILVLVYQQIVKGSSGEDAVAYAFSHSGLAICMASATTAAGMLSFLTAEVAPLRNLGVIAPFAVLYAFAVTMTILPAALAITPLRPHVRGEKRASVGLSERMLTWLGDQAVRHAHAVLVVAAVVLILACAGALRLRFAHDPVAWFPENHPTRVAIEKVDRVLGGSSSLEVVIDSGRENGLHEPENLRRIEAAMRFAEELRVGAIGVSKAISLVDIVKEGHQALNQNSLAYREIPDSRPVIAQELLLFENSGTDDLEKFTDSRFQTARVNMRLPNSDAVFYGSYLSVLDGGLREVLGEDLEYGITGNTTVMSRVFAAMVTSMGRSYLIALLVITPLMVLMIGNLRLGLISMVPNLFPVIFVLGVMGWMRLPLDTSNIVVGSIIIGLAVDDTIHFLQRFRVEFAGSGNVLDSVRATMRGTGAALLFTSLVLATGFLVMSLFGTMLNTLQFGALAALGIVVALVADLLVTPALITLTADRLMRQAPVGAAGVADRVARGIEAGPHINKI